MAEQPKAPYFNEVLSLLKSLIKTPSLSKQEDQTAQLIKAFLSEHGVVGIEQIGNNILVQNKHFDAAKPTILLNSHHDTVKPNAGYTRDPFSPDIEGDILYGLGSNDAGGPLVSLIATFLHFYAEKELKYNFLLCASSEEEISGKEGIALAKEHFPPIDFGIIGEPTQMDLAIAEKGLIVIDAIAHGKGSLSKVGE